MIIIPRGQSLYFSLVVFGSLVENLSYLSRWWLLVSPKFWTLLLDSWKGQESASSAQHKTYPIATASILWGSAWSRKQKMMYCDNEAVIAIINKGRWHCQAIMSILRRFTWKSAIHNFIIKAEHILGHSNEIADALYRFYFFRISDISLLQPTRIQNHARHWLKIS